MAMLCARGAAIPDATREGERDTGARTIDRVVQA